MVLTLQLVHLGEEVSKERDKEEGVKEKNHLTVYRLFISIFAICFICCRNMISLVLDSYYLYLLSGVHLEKFLFKNVYQANMLWSFREDGERNRHFNRKSANLLIKLSLNLCGLQLKFLESLDPPPDWGGQTGHVSCR